LELLEKIGAGGFGTVYHGIYSGLEVALKVVIERGSDNHSWRDALELAVMSTLSHPNILQVRGEVGRCAGRWGGVQGNGRVCRQVGSVQEGERQLLQMGCWCEHPVGRWESTCAQANPHGGVDMRTCLLQVMRQQPPISPPF
jgi:serine/threonine protein kinase